MFVAYSGGLKSEKSAIQNVATLPKIMVSENFSIAAITKGPRGAWEVKISENILFRIQPLGYASNTQVPKCA